MSNKIGESAGKLPQGDLTKYTLERQESDMKRRLSKKKLPRKINPKWSVKKQKEEEEKAKKKKEEHAARSAAREKGDDYDTSHGAMIKRQESYEARIKRVDEELKKGVKKGGKRRRKSRKRKRKTRRKRRRTRRKSRRKRRRRKRRKTRR